MAPRHRRLGLTDEDALRMYRLMLTARAIDDRASVLVRQGKVAFTVAGTGHEAAQVGGAWALRPGTDWVLPYYRDVALMLHLGMTPYEILLGDFGRAADPSSGGRQMPRHWSYPALRVVTSSSVVATQLPHAVGCALAARALGEEALAWVSFGDGAASKGDFHEALSFAALHKLPVLFFCQNNLYAISVEFANQSPVAQVADRAAAYGCPGVCVDGNDPFAVYEVVSAAAARARRGDGPTLVEARTYRLGPHTSNDDDRRYRTREEVDEWRARDPLLGMRGYLEEEGLLASSEAEVLAAAISEEIAEAAKLAEAAVGPSRDEVLRFVYAEGES